ncbi:ABC transporter permease [Pseudochelatococcus sp. B33]
MTEVTDRRMPGTPVKPNPAVEAAIAAHRKRTSGLRGVFRRLTRYPVLPALILVVVLVGPALLADVLRAHLPFVHNPEAGNLSARLLPPAWAEPTMLNGVQIKPGGNWEHILGTDKVGRDVLSRIIYGARVSIVVAALCIAVAGTVGTILGLLAGYLGGWWDHVIMRMVDLTQAIPTIILALVLSVVIGPGLHTVVTVISLVYWDRYTRLVRGEVLAIRSRDFVARAKISGVPTWRILVRHILPNVANTIIVIATLEVGQVILLEATMSFLGVGIPRPLSAWGLMVADGRDIIIEAWWVAFFPGLAILLTVLSMNLLGDWLHTRLDPKQKDR